MAESKEDLNYLRIMSLLYKVAPSAVRVKFDREFCPPNGLQSALKQDKFRVLQPLKKKRIINQVQWNLLFPTSGSVSSTTFDLTLMICLIRNLTKIQIADILPSQSDVSDGADLSRLKYYRNMFAHHDAWTLTNTDFETYWSVISQAILRLGGHKFKQMCDDEKEKIMNKVEIHEDSLCEWREEEAKVVRTRAISRTEELLITKDVIVAIGSSGCGKSTAIHHVALRLNNQEGYYIVPVHSPEEIIQYCEPEYKQVFVIDDVFGKSTIDIGLVNSWTRLSTDIDKLIKDHKAKFLHRGDNLAIFETLNEAMLMKYELFKMNTGVHYFVGGRNINRYTSGGDWRWIKKNGDMVKMTYFAFDDGEPNGTLSAPQDCMCFYATRKYTFHAVWCENGVVVGGYICQRHI